MKNNSFGLIAFCFFLTMSSAHADQCILPEDSSVKEAISSNGDGHEISCSYVDQIVKLVSEIQTFSESKVPVNLLVRRSYDGASFDGGLNIEAPEQLQFYGQWGQVYSTSIYANLVVVGHEYGHALLEDKIPREIGDRFPVIKAYNSARKEISKLEVMALKDPSSQKIKKLLAEKSEALKNNLEITKYFIISTAYSELYADVVSAYNENSKSAIFEALYYPEMNNFNFKYVQTRDFNTEFTEKHTTYMTEAHGYFAYTRNYIGKNLWPQNADQKKVMLKKIGDAIVSEITKILVNQAELPDFKVGNAGLIKALSK